MADIARNAALHALYDIDKNGAYLALATAGVLKNPALSASDRRFVTELTNGVVRYRLHLDYIIAQFSKVKKVSAWVQNCLRMGVYQILYLDRVPDSAAVNESVSLARRYGGARSAGFVNGLLRTVIREKDRISYPTDPLEALCIRESFPLWLGQHWCEEGGMAFAEDLMRASNQKAGMTVRCNTTKITPAGLTERLTAEGCTVEPVRLAIAPEMDCGLSVRGLSGLEQLESFQNGLFYVQDPAAMLVTEVLQPQPGETILDICAAPGGKTTHIAEKMGDTGRVIAFDIHPHKAKLIAQNAVRLGLSCIETHTADVTQGLPEWQERADRVLADVPCSGFGVIRHKPDIKYARVPEDIAAFAAQSLKLLNTAAGCIKPGGRLVFSTCTIEQAENRGVIDAFLQAHPEFTLVPFGNGTAKNDGTLSLYPHIDGTDGFFIASLKKSEV